MGEVGDWAKEFEEELAAEELAAGPDGSFDDEHDADMLPEEDAEPEPEVQEPEAAAAPIPRLRSGMSNSELEMYLQRFESASGVKLFIKADVTKLEHYSFQILSDLSSSVGRWQHVVDNLFAGDKLTADILMLKVREVRIAEAAAQKTDAKRLANHAAKQATLEKKRAHDEKGPTPEAPPQPARGNAFAALMPAAKSDGFQSTEVLQVPFPKKGFDVQGSEIYSHGRALRNRYVKKLSIRFWRFGIRNGRFWAIYLREIM